MSRPCTVKTLDKSKCKAISCMKTLSERRWAEQPETPLLRFHPEHRYEFFTYTDHGWLLINRAAPPRSGDADCGAWRKISWKLQELISRLIKAETRLLDQSCRYSQQCWGESGFWNWFCVWSQEPERAAGAAPGVASSFPGHGEGPEPRGAQGRVEDQGAEAPGGHQNPARKAASAGEHQQKKDNFIIFDCGCDSSWLQFWAVLHRFVKYFHTLGTYK